MGVPQSLRGVLTTEPYYRSAMSSSHVEREHLQIASFNDPHLNGRQIGLQILEDDLLAALACR